MSEESFSKTVRIDLLPNANITGSSSKTSADRIAGANWSTRRRQTAAAVAATRSKYEDLLQSVYDAAFITSIGGRILEVNDRAIEFLLYEKSKLCSLNFIDLLDGADETLMRSISDTFKHERFALLQAFCRRRDGTLFPAEIAVSHLSGDENRLCFFVRDITIRHNAEEMLRTEHTAVQTCGSGIAIADADGLLGYVNPAFVRMLGSDKESLLNENILEVFGGSEVLEELIEKAFSDNQTWLGELEIINVDGRPLSLQVSAACSRNAEDEVRGIVFSFADLTLCRQTEQPVESPATESETAAE
jgi:PAS domain S-box-containing protein